MPFGCEKVETVSIIAYPLDTLYHTEQRSFFEQYNNIEPKDITDDSKVNFSAQLTLQITNENTRDIGVNLVSKLIKARYQISTKQPIVDIEKCLREIKDLLDNNDDHFNEALKFIKPRGYQSALFGSLIPTHLRMLVIQTSIISKLTFDDDQDDITQWLLINKCETQKQYDYVSIDYISQNLTWHERYFFKAFLTPVIIGNINSLSPFVACDLDGSNGRMLLLALFSGMAVLLSDSDRRDLLYILKEEYATLTTMDNFNNALKSFQENTNIRDSLTRLVANTQWKDANIPVVIIGDAVFDRLLNKLSITFFFLGKIKKHGGRLTQGNHDNPRAFTWIGSYDKPQAGQRAEIGITESYYITNDSPEQFKHSTENLPDGIYRTRNNINKSYTYFHIVNNVRQELHKDMRSGRFDKDELSQLAKNNGEKAPYHIFEKNFEDYTNREISTIIDNLFQKAYYNEVNKIFYSYNGFKQISENTFETAFLNFINDAQGRKPYTNEYEITVGSVITADSPQQLANKMNKSFIDDMRFTDLRIEPGDRIKPHGAIAETITVNGHNANNNVQEVIDNPTISTIVINSLTNRNFVPVLIRLGRYQPSQVNCRQNQTRV